MKALFWGGLVLLALGIASLLVAIPSSQKDGFRVGGVGFSVETQHDEKVSPMVSAAMILGGAGLMVAARKKR
jgi:hypothetical protein